MRGRLGRRIEGRNGFSGGLGVYGGRGGGGIVSGKDGGCREGEEPRGPGKGGKPWWHCDSPPAGEAVSNWAEMGARAGGIR